MDKRYYIETEGQPRQELEPAVELLTDLTENFGVKEITSKGRKVLAREELKGQHYQYVFREPHGGGTLRRLMVEGQRFNLWVAIGETKNVGRRKIFTPIETYVIRNLLPHTRALSLNNHVTLISETLDRPEFQEAQPQEAQP